MITRTSQPASGAMLISEMKEFAGFPKATQRYIRRSLDVAYGRRDPIECWARDEGRGRIDPRPGPPLQAARPSAPSGSRRQRPRHDRAVHRHADHAVGVRPWARIACQNFAAYRFLYERLIGAARGRGCRRRSALLRRFRTCTRTAAASCCSRSARALRPRRAGRAASRCSGRSGSRRSTSSPLPSRSRLRIRVRNRPKISCRAA